LSWCILPVLARVKLKENPRGKGGKLMPQGIIGIVVVVIIVIVVLLLLGVL
jgi:hypothetical protein